MKHFDRLPALLLSTKSKYDITEACSVKSIHDLRPAWFDLKDFQTVQLPKLEFSGLQNNFWGKI